MISKNWFVFKEKSRKTKGIFPVLMGRQVAPYSISFQIAYFAMHFTPQAKNKESLRNLSMVLRQIGKGKVSLGY